VRPDNLPSLLDSRQLCAGTFDGNCVDWLVAVDDGSHGQSVGDVECGPSVDDVPRVVLCGSPSLCCPGTPGNVPACATLLCVRVERSLCATVFYLARQSLLAVPERIRERSPGAFREPRSVRRFYRARFPDRSVGGADRPS